MKFIGITGGVGAGKSAILSYLEANYACRVMLADEIAHLLMEPGTDCFGQLQEVFAREDVWAEDGSFDRIKLAAVLFTRKERRQQLNAIVHPAVKAYVVDAYARERREQRLDLLILEAALLIEENYDAICEELWYIDTSKANRRQRLKASRGYSDAKIDGIMASQLTEEEFLAHCQERIDNNSLPEDAFRQIDAILSRKGVKPRALA